MKTFKPGDRVAKHGTVQESRIAVNTHTLVKFDNDMEVYVPTDTLKPLKKRGRLVAKYQSTVNRNKHEPIGQIDDVYASRLLFDYIGKRVEVTVRLIEGEKWVG